MPCWAQGALLLAGSVIALVTTIVNLRTVRVLDSQIRAMRSVTLDVTFVATPSSEAE